MFESHRWHYLFCNDEVIFLEINHSIALKNFKNEMGQANHMLITIMVGLDGIIPYGVTAKEEFHTSWNPKSKNASVERSKVFAKKAAIAWLVDCLDMYLRLINQSPILIGDTDLKKAIDSPNNSRSVYKRILLMCHHYNIQSIDFALVDLLICWRNRLTHFQAENDITEQNRTLLEESLESITENHCGLNIQQTLKSFDGYSSPSFKEVTSFVRASINLISELDKCLLSDIGYVEYADKIIVKYLSDDSNRKLNNIFSKDEQTAEKSIRQILFQHGFTPQNPNNVDQFCRTIAKLNFQEAKIRLQQETFI